MLNFVWKFVNKIIIFLKNLQFWKDIILCYNKHITMNIPLKCHLFLHDTFLK
jgi:hypothetical protein